ncbi:hypothetical protein EDB19DRAFT_1837945 [Suillus lakei]|nr:hypothetical protein EDB19DRAFT_1837945 [Suillus lakei]
MSDPQTLLWVGPARRHTVTPGAAEQCEVQYKHGLSAMIDMTPNYDPIGRNASAAQKPCTRGTAIRWKYIVRVKNMTPVGYAIIIVAVIVLLRAGVCISCMLSE